MADDPTTDWPLHEGRYLILRTCNEQMQGWGDFQWPETGRVEAPDWDPDPTRECGGGLHGLLWGCGNAEYLANRAGSRWLIVGVDPADVANPHQPGKVRYKAGEVLLCTSDRDEAIDYFKTHGAAGLPVSWGTSTSGDWGTSTSGDGGTSTSGDRGTSTSGDRGTSTSGDRGTSTSGDRGTSTSGDRGTSTSGDRGTSTSGYRGTSTSGDRGTSTSGDRGTSTSGDRGTSTSGDRGTSTSGYGGTSTSGYRGIVVVRWYDYSANRYRLTVGYPGEDGIKENTGYRADGTGKLVEA